MNTPRLLQLSGIGPKDLLESHDIGVKVDSPGVGANFQDHPAMYLSFQCEFPIWPKSIVNNRRNDIETDQRCV